MNSTVDTNVPPANSDDLAPLPPLWRIASVLGTAAIFVGAILMSYVLGTRADSPSLVVDGCYAIACGGVVLGVVWLIALKRGLGGFGAVAGSFALAGSILYASMHRDDLLLGPGSAFFVFAGFLWFSAGHLFARGILVARFAAAAATLGFGILLVADAAHWRLSGESSIGLALCCGISLAFTGLVLAIEMPRLKTSRWSL